MTINRSSLTSRRSGMVAVLLVISVVLWFLERSNISWGFNWHYGVVGILVAWYLRMLVRDNSAATLTSFYQIYYNVGMLLSAAIVSSGAEMIEISRQGSANGFFWLMLSFFVIGIEATIFGYRNANLVWLRQSARRLPLAVDRAIILAFILPSLLLAAYVFVLTGGPILSGVDRVTFWRTVAPPGSSILRSIAVQSFFFVAFFFMWRHRSLSQMLLPWMVLIAYILVGLFVLGEKFSLFIILLNVWLIVLVGVIPEFHFNVRHIILAVLIGVMLLFTIAISYIFQDYEAAFILVRAALQSQLLWSVTEDPTGFSLLLQRPECYFRCDWFKDGTDYISFRYLPISTYNFYNEGGTKLSGFMPALPILTIGVIGTLFLHVMTCFALGIIQRKIAAALLQRQPIYGFLLFKLQFGIVIMWFTANMEPLPGLLVTFSAILLYRFIGVVQSDTGRSVQQGA